jgi:hypothetical protein
MTYETYCVLGTGAKQPTRCVLHVPVVSRYKRERMELLEVDELDEETRKMQTPGLPIHEHAELEVKLAPDGVATVVLKKGAADHLKSQLGPHPLW